MNSLFKKCLLFSFTLLSFFHPFHLFPSLLISLAPSVSFPLATGACCSVSPQLRYARALRFRLPCRYQLASKADEPVLSHNRSAPRLEDLMITAGALGQKKGSAQALRPSFLCGAIPHSIRELIYNSWYKTL